MAPEMTRLPHGTLRRSQIIETAYRIVAIEGEHGLTMRRLADALGTKPMSLYRHVASKDDVVDAVLELALEAGLKLPVQDDWRDEVIAIFTDFWRRMTLEPGLGAIVVSRSIPSENMAYTTNRIMKALVLGGFGDLAGRAVDTLLLFTLGAIAYDLSRPLRPVKACCSTTSMSQSSANVARATANATQRSTSPSVSKPSCAASSLSAFHLPTDHRPLRLRHTKLVFADRVGSGSPDTQAGHSFDTTAYSTSKAGNVSTIARASLYVLFS